MEQDHTRKAVKVFYSYVDGAHFFVSHEVKGLCAASRDLRAAYRAVGIQLGMLLAKKGEEPRAFEPSVPVEEFEQWAMAQTTPTPSKLTSGAVASWALKKMKNQRMSAL